MRIYAIGDIHGRADLLEQVFARINTYEANQPAIRPVHVLLGDYIDRGPASREVLDRLIERTQAHEVVCLKGNHETYILEFMQRPALFRQWSMLGGRETLMSYGLRPTIN